VLSCSGTTQAKLDATEKVMSAEDWAKLKLAHWEWNWLFTHAGWSRQHWHGRARNRRSGYLECHKKYLNKQVEQAWAAAALERRSWVFASGIYRGGQTECWGLTWCGVREFQRIPGIKQVFRHTPLHVPKNLSRSPPIRAVVCRISRESKTEPSPLSNSYSAVDFTNPWGGTHSTLFVEPHKLATGVCDSI